MRSDVILVGGGVMGCMSALRLAQAGRRPLVLERSVPGAEASSAAAGMLAAAIEASHPSQSQELSYALGRRSRALHAALAEELSDLGHEIGYTRCGALRVRFEGDAEIPDAPAAEDAEHLDAKAIRELEPMLCERVDSGLHLPHEAQVDPRRLLRAVAIEAERAGAVFRSGAYVQEVVTEGDRVRGVRVGAELLEAEHVVVAAGSWTSLVPGLGLEAAEVHPVRGQIVACDTRPPIFRRLVFGAGGYLCTRPSGEVLCGSTEERVGYRRAVTLGGIRDIVDLAIRLAPALANAPLLGQWSSFRPGTADGLPLVGPAGPENLWLASGHFRNGILLAPITGAIVAALIDGTTPPEVALLDALDPRRFA